MDFLIEIAYNKNKHCGGIHVKVAYYIIDAASGKPVPAVIRDAEQNDYIRTVQERWQTSWQSEFIQQKSLQKYALEVAETKELIGLGAYRDMPEGVLVYVEYLESAPHSNPTLTGKRKYRGIGAVLLAYGIQMSIDYGYGGAIYLKAKTSEIREHYIRDFGAVPFSRWNPYLLLIDGEAARELFFQYLQEE